MKKILVILLVLLMAFPFAACGSNDGDNSVVPTKGADATAELKVDYSSIDDLYLVNYVLKYDVQSLEGDQTLSYSCIEIAYNQVYMVSFDGGVTYGSSATSAFRTVSDAVHPARAAFSTHVAYRNSGTESDLKNEGTEEIAGFATTKYSISDKLYTYSFNVTTGDSKDYDLTLQYTKSKKVAPQLGGGSTLALSMKVTSLQFNLPDDTIKGMMQEAYQKIVTPSPAPSATTAPAKQ